MHLDVVHAEALSQLGERQAALRIDIEDALVGELAYTAHNRLTFSVMMRSTHFWPVSGRLQDSRILCAPPLALCSIVMTTFVPGLETRSIAPPMPLTILP